jgi:hypothetical protein
MRIYFLAVWRNLLRNKVFSVINITRMFRVGTLPYVNAIRLFSHNMKDATSAYSQPVDDQFPGLILKKTREGLK